MLQMVRNLKKHKDKLKACWGFDCLYMPPGFSPRRYDPSNPATKPAADDVETLWSNTGGFELLIYASTSEPLMRAQNLAQLAQDKGRPMTLKQVKDQHEDVLRNHWLEALTGANYLT